MRQSLIHEGMKALWVVTVSWGTAITNVTSDLKELP